MTMGRRIVLVGLVIAASVGIAGCGGDDDESPTSEAVEPAELAIYDWEASVANPNGFPTESAASAAGPKNAQIVRDELDPSRPRFFVVEGRPVLTAADIVDPQATPDPNTGEPAITFQFTEQGRGKFQTLTRSVARRHGQFAIVVDGEVLSLPQLDAAQYPNGIDGENGAQITGGFNVTEAEDLADRLAAATTGD